MFVRNFCNFFNINQVGVRVSKGFNKDCFCVFLNCRFEGAFYIRVYKCCGDTAGLRKSMCQKVVCSAVDGLGSYNVLTCFCKCLECIIDTSKERLDMASVKRVWEYLTEVLKNLKD